MTKHNPEEQERAKFLAANALKDHTVALNAALAKNLANIYQFTQEINTMNEFHVMPIKQRSRDGFKTRENLFVEARADTYMTLSQIALKYSLGKEKLMIILPPPDITCPHGNHTRLWARSTVAKVLEGVSRG